VGANLISPKEGTMTQQERAGRRIGVLFNDVDDFLQELAADTQAGVVERSIVRLCEMAKGTHQLVFVLAGYAEATTGRPVQLEQYVGQDWGFPNEQAVKLRDSSTRIKDQILAACEGHGLRVRGGAFRELSR